MPSLLRQYLGELFSDPSSPVPFETFMVEALYHPEFGYYTSHIDTVGGERGDFSTSASVSASFGRALANWISSTAPAGRFGAIEIGGGSGAWLRSVLNSLDRSMRRKADFKVVEISPPLQAEQREAIGWWRSRKIDWHREIASALSAEQPSLIFSNELVDAFPVILLQWNDDGQQWEEVHLSFSEESGLQEILIPLAVSRPNLKKKDFSIFTSLDPAPNQRIELHESYRNWLSETVHKLSPDSEMLTIDYGHESPSEIYAKRLGGTLRAYQHRNRLTGSGVYRLFGRQDITADVNFADLRQWGEAFGMETVRLESQADFLKRHLAADELQQDRETQYLLSEDGAGSAFRVLHQRKPRAETPV